MAHRVLAKSDYAEVMQAQHDPRGQTPSRPQIIRDSSPDLPRLLDDFREFGGVCVFETIFG